MSGKWTVVPGKKGNSNTTKEAVSKKLGGLQESTSTFAQFSRQTGSDDEEERQDVGPSNKTSKQQVTPSSNTDVPTKKKTVIKKPKVVKYDFDEFVRELNPKTIKSLTKEARQKYPTHPQNLLVEVTRQIQEQFGEVEVEREFAFANRTPGYPLTALSGPCQEPLLSVINSSPTLAQESIFRHCLDTLLAEVRAGQPSYGTRIILQLLITCKPSTCIECTQKVKLLLQSSLSKVPEALSLLWAGLPHPQLHLTAALEVWPELCLPLLYSTPNVPRQVLNYTVDYTCSLLRMVGEREADLFSKLPPAILCALLTSPQLSTRKAQTNIQEMFQLLQTTLVGILSDKEVSQYFTVVFKQLAEDKSQVAVSFAMCCLSHSVSSVHSWCKTFPSLPLSSQLLLKELASQEQLSPDLPLYELSITLSQIVARGSPEEKTLAQGLLTRHKAMFSASQQRQSATGRGERVNMTGGWCSGCGFLLVLLSIVYLALLSLILVQLARNGPGELMVMIQQYVPVRKEWLDFAAAIMWQVLSMCVQFWNEITNRLF